MKSRILLFVLSVFCALLLPRTHSFVNKIFEEGTDQAREKAGLAGEFKEYLEAQTAEKIEGAVRCQCNQFFRGKPKNLKALLDGPKPKNGCNFPVIGVGRGFRLDAVCLLEKIMLEIEIDTQG